MAEYVVLVDEQDRELGVAEKMDAHRRGALHRAFSVFVVSARGEVLLQRRALGKYHSGGLWANACCGHPRPGEEVIAAGERRLFEEMGIRVSLREAGSFVYEARLDHELTEHEVDHVLIGSFDGTPKPDPSEVMEWKWVAREALEEKMKKSPEQFTAWFREAFAHAKKHLKA